MYLIVKSKDPLVEELGGLYRLGGTVFYDTPKQPLRPTMVVCDCFDVLMSLSYHTFVLRVKYLCPARDSNPHCTTSKAAFSTVGIPRRTEPGS